MLPAIYQKYALTSYWPKPIVETRSATLRCKASCAIVQHFVPDTSFATATSYAVVNEERGALHATTSELEELAITLLQKRLERLKDPLAYATFIAVPATNPLRIDVYESSALPHGVAAKSLF